MSFMPNKKTKATKQLHSRILKDIHNELLDLGLPIVSIDSLGNITMTEDATVGQLNQARDYINTAVDVEAKVAQWRQNKQENKRFRQWKEEKLRTEWELAGKPDKYNAHGGA